MFYYTTWGPIRGGCGHKHRTLAGAVRCLARDRAGCARQGGYSDRMLRVLESGQSVEAYDVAKGPGFRPESAEEARPKVGGQKEEDANVLDRRVR